MFISFQWPQCTDRELQSPETIRRPWILTDVIRRRICSVICRAEFLVYEGFFVCYPWGLARCVIALLYPGLEESLSFMKRFLLCNPLCWAAYVTINGRFNLWHYTTVVHLSPGFSQPALEVESSTVNNTTTVNQRSKCYGNCIF